MLQMFDYLNLNVLILTRCYVFDDCCVLNYNLGAGLDFQITMNNSDVLLTIFYSSTSLLLS